MKNEHSSKKIWVICSIVLAVGFVAAGYLNYVQYQRNSDNARLLNGTITDLRYQLDLDTKALGVKPSPSASPSPTPISNVTPTPSATPTATAIPAATPPPAAATTATTNQAANFRRTATSNGQLIARLPKGTVVTLTGGTSGSYTAVSYGGNTGYILSAALN